MQLRTAAIAALAAIGLGTGLGLTASAGAAASGAATRATAGVTARSPRYVVLNCNFKPQVRPGSYVWTCADYGMGLQDAHWTSWTAKLASGYGTMWENDCTPDCAGGKIIHYPALAMFWGSAPVRGYPADWQYTRLTLIFPGKRPPVYQLKNGKAVTTHPLTQTFGIRGS